MKCANVRNFCQTNDILGDKIRLFPKGLTHEISYLVYDAARHLGIEDQEGVWKFSIEMLLLSKITNASKFSELEKGSAWINEQIEAKMRQLLAEGWKLPVPVGEPVGCENSENNLGNSSDNHGQGLKQDAQ